MSRALLLDEMLSPAIAHQLRALGCDASSVAERHELRSLDDAAVLAAATREGRVLVTSNVRDFVVLDRLWQATSTRHCGMVLVNSRRFPATSHALGMVVSALRTRHERDQWPSDNEAQFL